MKCVAAVGLTVEEIHDAINHGAVGQWFVGECTNPVAECYEGLDLCAEHAAKWRRTDEERARDARDA